MSTCWPSGVIADSPWAWPARHRGGGRGAAGRAGLWGRRRRARPGAAEGWRKLAAAPLSPRVGHSAVWTGGELLIWGGGPPGGQPKADGAAYDPAADRWRRLPPAPLTGRSGHATVWTGTEMLVWGGATGQDCADGCPRADGLAYRPA